MQFLTLAALFGAAALAAPAAQTPDCPNPAHCQGPPDPATYENLNVSNYTITTLAGEVTSVEFYISGKNATDLLCASGPLAVPQERYPRCGDSKYTFGIVEDKNETSGFSQLFFHELGPAVGFIGHGPIPTKCYAFEADGPVTCVQDGLFTAVLS